MQAIIETAHDLATAAATLARPALFIAAMLVLFVGPLFLLARSLGVA